MTEHLSPSAQKIIHEYFNLPFFGISGARCPYFNNAKIGQRGQLKVLIGKGAPTEITEEAKIISAQYCRGLFDKSGICGVHLEHPAEHEEIECVRQFLVDNNLGVDCSGFVTNVLQKHYKETGGFDFSKKIFITPKKFFLRWIISRLRPIEQINVKIYANDKNTGLITDLTKIKPADVIIMLKTGPNKNHDHILLITEAEESASGKKIKYAHSRAWFSEGKYGHGVSEGTINVVNPQKGLLDQLWEEKNKINEENETYREAKQASILEIRRIRL
jgi:hypothetical protein